MVGNYVLQLRWRVAVKQQIPTIKPTIYLPKWKFWLQLSPKYFSSDIICQAYFAYVRVWGYEVSFR